MKNTKGLSEVVTTLIIILLVLVAIGIIWVVISGVIKGGAGQIDVSTKCIAVDLSALSVNETSAGVYDITLHRGSGGDELGGVKITLFNSTVNSGVLDFGVALTELQTTTKSIDTGLNVTEGNKLEYTAYFLDASGNPQLCSQTGTFPF